MSSKLFNRVNFVCSGRSLTELDFMLKIAMIIEGPSIEQVLDGRIKRPQHLCQ
jgi:hypothetical protein